MKKFPSIVFVLTCLTVLSSVPHAHAQLALGAAGTYAQDFDTLPLSGTIPWINNVTLAGWFAQREIGTLDLVASTGSATGGALYSYGASGSSERALGSLGSSGTGAFAWGVIFQNTSSTALTFSNISYVGEEWRRGATGKVDTVDFDYRIDPVAATNLLAASGWTAINALDFTNPNTAGGSGALDGNNAANRVAISFAPSLTLAPGQFITFRWLDIDHAGSDNGLAIDNVSFSYEASAAVVTAVPESSSGVVTAVMALLLMATRHWKKP